LRFLLDENIPLRLQHRLAADGLESEHIITMGRRGLPDAAIRARLAVESDLVLLTHDTEFESIEVGAGTVIISRVPQGLPVRQRVELWIGALSAFATDPPPGKLFDLLPTGQIVGWEIRPLNPPT
jgi:hypothetical protein